MGDERGLRAASAAGADRLSLVLRPDRVPLFFPLLQKGFRLEVQAGVSVRSLLVDQLGVSAEYLEGRIQTIFVDGKPIDDLDRVAVRDGSTLALSSAMPGLLGATLRRGGYYAVLRSQISHRGEDLSARAADGIVLVKLFNLTLVELGPSFLERGGWVTSEDLAGLLKKLPADFPQVCREARLNGRGAPPEGLAAREWKGGWICLKVQAG